MSDECILVVVLKFNPSVIASYYDTNNKIINFCIIKCNVDIFNKKFGSLHGFVSWFNNCYFNNTYYYIECSNNKVGLITKLYDLYNHDHTFEYIKKEFNRICVKYFGSKLIILDNNKILSYKVEKNDKTILPPLVTSVKLDIKEYII